MTSHPLHRAIFADDVDGLRSLLAASSSSGSPHPDLSERFRGHTPLTLAIGLNRKECVRILLDHGASTLLKTQDGWSPFQEATSVGDREIMEWIFRSRRTELGLWFQNQGKDLLTTLSNDVKDFYLEMHWQFQSWIPFVSQLCPSDTYKVYKKGTSVRIDTTLVGFERLSWIRGNISIIFSETPEGPRLVICDHQRNLVQQVYPRDFTLTDQDVEEELSVSLNTNIIAPPEIDFQSFNLSRAQNGFWTFKVDRNEKVGPWDTQVWNVECLEFVNRVRTEHLDVEPLPEMVRRERKSAAAKAAPPPAKKPPPRGLVIVNADADDEAWASEATENAKQIDESDDWSQAKRHFHELAAFRGSLEPPAPTTMTADEFFDESKKDVHLHVGRPKVEKSTSKGFKATIWVYNGEGGPPKSVDAPPVPLSENGAPPSTTGPPAIQSSAFPIELSTLLPLLDLIGMGSNQHMRSLREFFNVQLPPGFPVKVEIPVNMLPLSAVITFQNINTSVDMPQEMFNIPGKKEGYRAGEVVRGSTEGTAS